MEQWIWCVRNLDWLGKDGEAICQKIAAAGSKGLWMSAAELLGYSEGVYQTIEGEFWAFPRHINPLEVTADDLNLRAFSSSRAELAIIAVDGGFFEVYAKDSDFLSPLRGFQDVRDENPNDYI